MNGRNTRPLSILVLLLVLMGIGFYLNTNRELLQSVRTISWGLLGLLVLLRFLFLALNGWMLKLFVRRFNVLLRWQEWLGLALVTTLGNYLTPFSGGMVARASYLKLKHRLAFAHFASLLAASYLLTFAGAATVGLVCLIWLGLWQRSTLFLSLFFLIVLLGVGVAMVLPIAWLPQGDRRPLRLLRTMLEGWHQLRQDRQLVGQLVGVTAVSMLLNGVAFWVAYHALGFDDVTFPAAVLVSLSAVFSVILTITPGNVGIREAFVSLTSELIEVGVGEGLLVALLIRLGTLATVFTLGPLFSVWLTRQLDQTSGGGVKRS